MGEVCHRLSQLAGTVTHRNFCFAAASATGGFARCAAPLKSIIIGWNGEIQFCKPVGIVANINRQSLEATWSNGICARYRLAQLTKDASIGPKCMDCTHAT